MWSSKATAPLILATVVVTVNSWFLFAEQSGEMSYVIDAFESIQEAIWKQVYNDQGFIDYNITEPGEALFGARALKVDYEVVQTENWGGFVDFGWMLEGSEVYNCMGATHLSLHYKILEEQSSPGRVHLRIIASDDSDCVSDCSETINVEVYYAFHYILDNSQNGEWQEIRIPLFGDGNVESPFWRTGWVGIVGNDQLDPNHLKGFRIELSIDSQGDLGSSSSGSLLLDQFACVGGEDLLGAAFHAVPSGPFEDAVNRSSWLDPSFPSELSRNRTEALFDHGLLSVNYTIEAPSLNNITVNEAVGGILEFRHRAPASAYYNLTQASGMAIDYQVNRSATARFGIALEIDGGDEFYRQFLEVLNEENGSSGTLSVAFGSIDSVPDLSTVKGFRIEFSIDPDADLGSLVTGVMTIGSFVAELEQSPAAGDPSTDPGNSGLSCSVEEEVMLDETLPIFTKKEFLAGQCCELCDADEDCLYGVATAAHCYTASYLMPSAVKLSNTQFAQTQIHTFVTNDASKRGDYCEVCECVEADNTIDCRGQDLAITPNAFSKSWLPKVLDLRDNPRLLLIDAYALTAIARSLQKLILPKGLRHLSPKSANNLPSLVAVEFEGDRVGSCKEAQDDEDCEMEEQKDLNINNVVTHTSDFFDDVCCGRGGYLDLASTSQGLTFCDMKVDTPGVDSVFEPFVQYFEADPIATLRPSSSFLAEAAESAEKCAEFCAISEGCRFFSYDARFKESEHICYLLADNGTRSDFICCDSDDYADDEGIMSGWTSGRPPRTRHVDDNARVLIETPHLVLESANGYSSQLEVSLGSTPLRGAVWIEPILSSTTELDISIYPKRVALYDNNTKATITVTVLNIETASISDTLVITQDIQSCDHAFTFSYSHNDAIVYIDVIVDRSKTSDNVVLPTILIPIVVIVAILSVLLYLDLKRRQTDSLWSIKASELHFGDPPDIIGRGTFGFVLLAEYHGTMVAVKRVVPPKHKPSRPSSGNHFEHFKKIESSKKLLDIHATELDQDVEIGTSSGATGASDLNIGMMSGTKNRGVGPNKSYDKSKRGSMFGRDSYARQKKEFVAEMRILSKLRHPCVTTVIGAVVGPKEEPLLVMEYMDHGSLYDLLHNETAAIEGEQILPILRDVAQGLRFLHAADPKVIHGDLKAQNILVSSNFRAKVCDFGLSHTRNNWLGAVGTPYWMAPELLRGESKNTAPSDVYSFGIMLYEIYSRRDPYEGEDYKHVLRLARDPAVNKRPPVPERCPKTVATVMKHCVVNNPKERPTFEELDLLMKGLDLADVEPKKIACSLQDYLEERQPRRGDRLDERFPAHVADALREGRKLEPESRKMVSLFYSEIVRLGDIVGDHGAEKTSNLLRSLYDRFDVLAREYDVFKIETIGDSYMVASNLAKDQVDHAKRIVEFANSAIKTASETLIDPEKGHLKIRVGFHSGPLVANVVGERHPRYSIFGDSVNTAIRMVHDSGENRIHCSEVAARLVRQQYPETSIRSRGVINVKGKGEMHTYWVNVRSPDSKSDNAVSVDFSFDSSQQSSQERDVNFGNIVSTGVPEESAIPVTVTVSEHAHDEKANNETDDSTEADPTKSSLQLFMKYRNTQV